MKFHTKTIDIENMSCVGGWTIGNMMAKSKQVADFWYDLFINENILSLTTLEEMKYIDPDVNVIQKYGIAYGFGIMSEAPGRIPKNDTTFFHFGNMYGYTAATLFKDVLGGFTMAIAVDVDQSRIMGGFIALFADLQEAVCEYYGVTCPFPMHQGLANILKN